jgi:hypothetical protein
MKFPTFFYGLREYKILTVVTTNLAGANAGQRASG